ncbi:hypothetical protein D4R47_04260 [archaeon]|nr:MAG: hypothetical protein D4R47_04260 [archaeon]
MRVWTISIIAVMLLVVALPGTATGSTQPGHVLGLGIPAIGTLHYDEANELTSVSGFNLALGFSTRHFTITEGLKPGRFNSYTGWGTLLLIIPYIEIGTCYPIPMGGGDQYLVIDFGLLYYFIPRIGISLYY